MLCRGHEYIVHVPYGQTHHSKYLQMQTMNVFRREICTLNQQKIGIATPHVNHIISGGAPNKQRESIF